MDLKPKSACSARLGRWSTASAVLLLIAACGGSSGGGKTTTVGVTLKEFSVTLDSSTAPHGRVKFHVTNVGEDMHEFLVIKTDLAPDKLPTNPDGSYEEGGPGTDFDDKDEISLVNPGESKDLTLKLQAGHYVLICNMVHMEESGEVEVHYQLGMHTAFTVS